MGRGTSGEKGTNTNPISGYTEAKAKCEGTPGDIRLSRGHGECCRTFEEVARRLRLRAFSKYKRAHAHAASISATPRNSHPVPCIIHPAAPTQCVECRGLYTQYLENLRLAEHSSLPKLEYTVREARSAYINVYTIIYISPSLFPFSSPISSHQLAPFPSTYFLFHPIPIPFPVPHSRAYSDPDLDSYFSLLVDVWQHIDNLFAIDTYTNTSSQYTIHNTYTRNAFFPLQPTIL